MTYLLLHICLFEHERSNKYKPWVCNEWSKSSFIHSTWQSKVGWRMPLKYWALFNSCCHITAQKNASNLSQGPTLHTGSLACGTWFDISNHASDLVQDMPYIDSCGFNGKRLGCHSGQCMMPSLTSPWPDLTWPDCGCTWQDRWCSPLRHFANIDNLHILKII